MVYDVDVLGGQFLPYFDPDDTGTEAPPGAGISYPIDAFGDRVEATGP